MLRIIFLSVLWIPKNWLMLKFNELYVMESLLFLKTVKMLRETYCLWPKICTFFLFKINFLLGLLYMLEYTFIVNRSFVSLLSRKQVKTTNVTGQIGTAFLTFLNQQTKCPALLYLLKLPVGKYCRKTSFFWTTFLFIYIFSFIEE